MKEDPLIMFVRFFIIPLALILTIIATACAIVYEPLPGLCYTDKDGTYLCPEEEELLQ